MADLSKIKLNGIEYNIKDTVARNMVSPPLATETTDGLLSADDKKILNGLNLQVVILMTADGFVLDKKVIGEIPDLPDEES